MRVFHWILFLLTILVLRPNLYILRLWGKNPEGCNRRTTWMRLQSRLTSVTERTRVNRICSLLIQWLGSLWSAHSWRFMGWCRFAAGIQSPSPIVCRATKKLFGYKEINLLSRPVWCLPSCAGMGAMRLGTHRRVLLFLHAHPSGPLSIQAAWVVVSPPGLSPTNICWWWKKKTPNVVSKTQECCVCGPFFI